jgi:hypothetical protein
MSVDGGLFADLPPVACWRLEGAYDGFEVARFSWGGGGLVLEGTTVGHEQGVPWTIHYVVEVAADWHVRRARLTDYAGTDVRITADGAGSWAVDGDPRPDLAGCLDLDLEASVVTNTLPVHRLSLRVGEHGVSVAAYVRTAGLVVERLEQTYLRRPDEDGGLEYLYESPRFGYRDSLRFGPDGLVIVYPGVGARVAAIG